LHTLFVDEANLDETKDAVFFVCGGIFFDAEAMPAIHRGVEGIRAKYGFRPSDEFKFNTRSKPKHMSQDQFGAAKDEAFDVARRNNVRFIGYAIQHYIARRPGGSGNEKNWRRDRHYMGLHAVAAHFHLFLESVGDHGVFVCDRLPFKDDFSLLPKLYRESGIKVGDFEPRRPFDRICAFTTTVVNASNAASLADIILGAFRYCVNDRRRDAACGLLFPKVHELMWGEGEGTERRVLEKGLLLRPRNIGSAECRVVRQELVTDFSHFLGSPLR
jgi:hypothetical protein